LVNDQRGAQFFTMHLFLFLTLYMFRAHRAHHQERQIASTQPLVTVTLKIGASRWSFAKNHNRMHGQQNVTVACMFDYPNSLINRISLAQLVWIIDALHCICWLLCIVFPVVPKMDTTVTNCVAWLLCAGIFICLMVIFKD
jgi:hypothetical protein